MSKKQILKRLSQLEPMAALLVKNLKGGGEDANHQQQNKPKPLWQHVVIDDKPTINSPQELWDVACNYFRWVGDNPLFESKAFAYKGQAFVQELPHIHAMTMSGFLVYSGLTKEKLTHFRQNNDYEYVVTLIEQTIYEQKFSAAAAELLSANFIAKDLGLADKANADEIVKEEMTPWSKISVEVDE